MFPTISKTNLIIILRNMQIILDFGNAIAFVKIKHALNEVGFKTESNCCKCQNSPRKSFPCFNTHTFNSSFLICSFPSIPQFLYEFVRVQVQPMFLAEVNPEFGAHYKAKPSVRSVFTIHH